MLSVIKTKYSGEATDLFIRQADKMSRGIERNFRDIQQIKVTVIWYFSVFFFDVQSISSNISTPLYLLQS